MGRSASGAARRPPTAEGAAGSWPSCTCLLERMMLCSSCSAPLSERVRSAGVQDNWRALGLAEGFDRSSGDDGRHSH